MVNKWIFNKLLKVNKLNKLIKYFIGVILSFLYFLIN